MKSYSSIFLMKLFFWKMKLKSDITTISETQFSAGIERGKSLGLAEGLLPAV